MQEIYCIIRRRSMYTTDRSQTDWEVGLLHKICRSRYIEDLKGKTGLIEVLFSDVTTLNFQINAFLIFLRNQRRGAAGL